MRGLRSKSVLVTCPISKEAVNLTGFREFSGHTGYLAKKTGTAGTVMMLLNDKLKISLVTEHVPLKDVSSRINSTWGGNLVDMVRSSQILQIIEEDNLCENAATVGAYLKNGLLGLAKKFDLISNVRGKGLMCAFDFPRKEMRDAFINKGMEKNVMFLGCGNQTIRFRPALCMESRHIDEGLAVMEQILIKL